MAETMTGRVSIEEGVVVGRAGGRDLKADIYTPPPGTSSGAGVFLLHGGGWATGDRSQLRGYGILLGRIGYTCVAGEYRLTGEAKWPAQIHDAKATLRWMRANSDKLGIDPEKIAVSGNSAGGHLSLMVAGTPSVVEFEGDGGNPGVPTHVAACIAYYAPAMLYSPEGQLSEFLENLFGKAYAQDTAKQASPIAHASAAFPPTMLVTGNADELVPYEASFTMYRALMDAGAKAELHVYSDAPHAFDAVSEFGRQTANIMALFLDRYVVRPRTLTRAAVAAARA